VTGCRPDHAVADDPEPRFRETFDCLGEALEAAAPGFETVVEMTSCPVDLRRHRAAFLGAKDEFIRPPHPAWSCIGRTDLITEGTLVALRVICRRG